MPSMLETLAAIKARLPEPKPERPITERIAPAGTRPHDWQMMSTLSAHERFGLRPAVTDTPDLERILALPRRPQIDDEQDPVKARALIELMTGRLRRTRITPCTCGERGCIRELKFAQAWALYELSIVGGLLGPIGVGHGKTGLDILAPLVIPNCKVAVLLIPPGLREQLLRDYLAWDEHFNVPTLMLDNGKGYIVPGAPTLHVVPFSKFSRATATDLLESIRPDTIIIDEAHKARHPDTATTKRILRYFSAHPETRLACWSGTLTAASIEDYAHLSALALREQSPLPLDPGTVKEWALAIDPSDWPAPMGHLMKLCEPGEHIHQGYHRRLVQTMGVVATKAGAIDASINLHERKVETPAHVKDLLKDVRATWIRPDGEELVEIIEMKAAARQLACGFYYRWKFPKGEPEDLILRWFAARKAWHKELREKLKRSREHLDSPLLCAKAAIRYYQDPPYTGDLPTWNAEHWLEWRDLRDQVYHETEAIWVDDFLAQDAATWALKHRGVVWYEHEAFGRRVAELSGLPMHAGGPGAEDRILAEKGDRSIIASIKAHGTGRDGLQHKFHEQLVANPPSGGDAWEQLLGRLHRIGQRADEVDTWVYRHETEMADAIDSAVVKAKYIQGTMGTRMKLLNANTTFSIDIDP